MPRIVPPARYQLIRKVLRQIHRHRAVADPRRMRGEPAQGDRKHMVHLPFRKGARIPVQNTEAGTELGPSRPSYHMHRRDHFNVLFRDKEFLCRLPHRGFLRRLVRLDHSAGKADLTALADPRLADLKQDAQFPFFLDQRDQDRVPAPHRADLLEAPSGCIFANLLQSCHADPHLETFSASSVRPVVCSRVISS